MRKPYFHVGEEVILQSVSRPDLNGEYTVRQVLDDRETYICRATGENIRPYPEGFHYTLEEVVPLTHDGFENCWRESALRRKHKPSDDSFEQMMNKLKEKEHV